MTGLDGYEVISVNDDKCIGHVSGRVGDYLIVEHGHLRKSHNPLPLSFADVDEVNQRVVTTLSHDIVYDAPSVKGHDFDQEAAALHYGLAQSEYDGSETEVERSEIRDELSSGTGADDTEPSPALLGDRERER